jgi:S-formylglutathione hydrolase FrmB
VAGWFDVNTGGPTAPPNDQAKAANSLCALGSSHGIACAVVAQPGTHDWPFATGAFKASLPWLAGAIGTPDVPVVGLPAASNPPAFVETGKTAGPK